MADTAPIESPVRDPMDNLLGYQLRRASAVMMAHLAATLAETGLRPPEATILLVVEATPGLTQSDLGRLLGIKRANMVPLVSGLLAADLVERTPVDGRSHALSLTTAGAAMAERLRRLIDKHETRFAAVLDPDQREAVLAALRSIREVRES